MNAGFLDVLLYSGYHNSGFVGQGINVDLGRPFEEFVDQNRLFRRCIDRRTHVFVQGLIIVNDRHSSAAQYETRAHDDWITYFVCNSFSFFC